MYRQQRMEQMQAQAARPRFGSVIEISKPEWEQEVQGAPQGTFVVIALYQNHIPVCHVLLEIFDRLARKHVNVKFIKAVATSCVENFHNDHCPGMFTYKDGELVHSDVPCAQLFGGLRMTEQTVEYVLAERGIVEVEFEEDPRDKLKLMNMVTKRGKDVVRRHEREDDDSDGDDREYVNNQYQRYR